MLCRMMFLKQTSYICLHQIKPPIQQTDRRTGSTSSASVIRSIRNWKGMFAKYVQTVLPVASKILVSSGIFSRQPSNSCTSARPQNPLPTRMGGSAGADSKQCFTKMPDSCLFFLNCRTKYFFSTTLCRCWRLV